jgi:hypothetical protein
MPNKKLLQALCLILFIQSILAHKMVHYSTDDILAPEALRPYMFKTEITGQIDIMIPFKQSMNLLGKIEVEEYEIEMVKTKQQLLPANQFNATTIYAYAGQTQSGYKAVFPGPTIMATKNRPLKVTWKNNI